MMDGQEGGKDVTCVVTDCVVSLFWLLYGSGLYVRWKEGRKGRQVASRVRGGHASVV